MRKKYFLLFLMISINIYSEDFGIIVSNNVQVLANPDFDSDVLGQAELNTKVIILSKSITSTVHNGSNSGWYYINNENIYGWVYSSNVIPIYENEKEFDYVFQNLKDGYVEQYYLSIGYVKESLHSDEMEYYFKIWKEDNYTYTRDTGKSGFDFRMYDGIQSKTLTEESSRHNENAGGDFDISLNYDKLNDIYTVKLITTKYDSHWNKDISELVLTFKKRLSLFPGKKN